MSRVVDYAYLLVYFSFSLLRFLADYMREGKAKKNAMLSLEHVVNLQEIKNKNDGALLFYAATIGELTGVRSFINEAMEKWPERPLVIVSGQPQYVEAMSQTFPSAVVCSAPSVVQAIKLFIIAKPKLVCFAEGPCLFNCFPIRLELSIPAITLWYGTPFLVINAAFHEKQVNSRLDFVEDVLFSELYRRAVDFYYVSSEYFASLLISERVKSEKIQQLGDVKFENVFLKEEAPISSDLQQILKYFDSTDSLNVIAGSVNTIDEQVAVITGWQQLCKTYPSARLVLAPRQILQPKTMEPLYAYLKEKNIAYSKRSDGVEGSLGSNVLILDVFGELPHFYSIASICYIGINHGLLEPLRYSKPVIVAPDNEWKSTYVTYPQYAQMVSEGAIMQLQSKQELGNRLIELMTNQYLKDELTSLASSYCQSKRGAGQRILQHLEQSFTTE